MSKIIHICAPDPGQDPMRQRAKEYYQKSLERAGAAMSWLPLSDIPDDVASLYDGLLLPGGGDLDPSLWGATPEPGSHEPDALRDHADLFLFKKFYHIRRPILGICRGLQVINVALGGTLHQDITLWQGLPHMAAEDRLHPLTVIPGSLLHHILKMERPMVNSLHHQVAARPASSLRAVAYSDDGWIEAVEHLNYPFLLGIQWHPERMHGIDVRQQKIFEAFVASCRPAPVDL